MTNRAFEEKMPLKSIALSTENDITVSRGIVRENTRGSTKVGTLYRILGPI